MSEESKGKDYVKSDLSSEFGPKSSALELPSKELVRRHANLGLETSKTSNIHYIDGSNIVMAGGTSVRIFNVMTSESRYLKSVGGGGIGALAVSHNKKFIAVAERSITESAPNIYVYEYPSLKIVRVLRNGTERSYSALAFNTSDTKLASVGAFPDFMLTVWDWEKEKIILQNKAFSHEIFEKVKQLRERRLDQTEVLNAYRKSSVDVKKSLNRLHARERQIVKDMEKAHFDIEALHSEKQQEMNKIRTVVPLRLSQLCGVSDGDSTRTLPEDSSECIVVDRNEIGRLKVQIARHVEEKKSHSVMFKDLHRHHKKIGRDTTVKEKEILKLENKCEKIQLLKFGHELDLESLDKMTVNKSVVEMQKKVKIESSKQERTKRQYREEMKTAQERQFEATKRNTELLTRLAELTARVQEIDAAVKKNDFESKTDKPGLTNKDIKDRKRLVQLLRIQAREIDALKAEINSIRTSKI